MAIKKICGQKKIHFLWAQKTRSVGWHNKHNLPVKKTVRQTMSAKPSWHIDLLPVRDMRRTVDQRSDDTPQGEKTLVDVSWVTQEKKKEKEKEIKSWDWEVNWWALVWHEQAMRFKEQFFSIIISNTGCDTSRIVVFLSLFLFWLRGGVCWPASRARLSTAPDRPMLSLPARSTC